MRPSELLLRLTAALVLTVVVACGGSDDGSSSAPAPSAAAAPSAPLASSVPTSPEPTPSPAQPASPPPQGSKGGVVLGGEELGVTRLGEPFREAVAAVSTVLGEPDEDPAQTVSCILSQTEVRWGGFVLAAQDERLAGWSSTSETLQTPSGVTVGTPVADVEGVYGPSLERFPANPDNPPTFSVADVDVLGELSSADDDAQVTRLFTSFCGGP